MKTRLRSVPEILVFCYIHVGSVLFSHLIPPPPPRTHARTHARSTNSAECIIHWTICSGPMMKISVHTYSLHIDLFLLIMIVWVSSRILCVSSIEPCIIRLGNVFWIIYFVLFFQWEDFTLFFWGGGGGNSWGRWRGVQVQECFWCAFSMPTFCMR